MKIVAAAALAAFAGLPLAQSAHDSHHQAQAPAKKDKAAAQTHNAVGVVKSVNAEKGTVTIAHEPVASLNWPGMTMGFKPQDTKLLERLKPGQKIQFRFVQQGKDYVITQAE